MYNLLYLIFFPHLLPSSFTRRNTFCSSHLGTARLFGIFPIANFVSEARFSHNTLMCSHINFFVQLSKNLFYCFYYCTGMLFFIDLLKEYLFYGPYSSMHASCFMHCSSFLSSPTQEKKRKKKASCCGLPSLVSLSNSRHIMHSYCVICKESSPTYVFGTMR